MTTISQIESKISELIMKETGCEVVVTMRAKDEWTISGVDAHRAANWMQTNGLMTLTDTAEYDDDCITYCYMKSH